MRGREGGRGERGRERREEEEGREGKAVATPMYAGWQARRQAAPHASLGAPAKWNAAPIPGGEGLGGEAWREAAREGWGGF